jgi:hypothetical protein
VLGRLRSGIQESQAQTALNANRTDATRIVVMPYTGTMPDAAGGMRRVGLLLSAASGVVFLIACANVATFLLARASARSRETAVRVALGASRRRLAAHLLADSIVLSVAGAAMGLLLAIWMAGVLPAFLFDQDAEQLRFVPDAIGSIAVAGVCGAIMILCGLTPLLEVRHDDPALVLRRESAGPSNQLRRLREALVVGQMACCCLLVVFTTILYTGFRQALQTGAGERLQHAVIATLEAAALFSRPDLGLRYFREAERAALSTPGIFATAWSGTPPGSRPGWQAVRIEQAHPPLHDVVVDIADFTPESLALVKLPPLSGRMFGIEDSPRSCPVVVVNKTAAGMFDGDPVGQSIEDATGRRLDVVGVVDNKDPDRPHRPTIFYYPAQAGSRLNHAGTARFRIPVSQAVIRGVIETHVVSASYFEEVDLPAVAGSLFGEEPGDGDCRVGVINEEAAVRYFGRDAVGGAIVDASGRRTGIVGVVRSPRLRASQRGVEPAVYLPFTQDFLPRMTLILNARASGAALVSAVRDRVSAVPGGRTLPVVVTLEEHLRRTALASERIAAVLVGACATTGLVLGILGLYGAMNDAARQRRRQYAVRLALGAPAWRVVKQVLGEGLWLAAMGAAVGLAGSFFLARSLTRLTPSAAAPDLKLWAIAPLLLLAATLAASVLPARRTLAVDPLTVMRDD